MHNPRLLAALALGALAATALADGMANPTPTSLYLRAGTVDASTPKPGLAAQIGLHQPGERYVIQLDGPVTPQHRARLAAAGLTPGAYLPSNAFIVTLDKADAGAVAGLEFIRWWSPYRAEWKLDPEIGKRTYLTPERLALAKQGRDLLTVVAFRGADTGALARAIFAIPGAEVLDEQFIAGSVEMTVRMALADAPALADLPAVQFVEPAPEVTERSNLNTRWVIQSNISGVRPVYDAGIRGEGQIVGILDSRVSTSHCSFSDPVNPIGPTHRKIVGMASTGTAGSHGTHCAGTAVGDAGAEANTRGVAYMGKLSWASSGGSGFFGNTLYNHNNGARVHTNSWGNDGTTSYDALCRAIDDFSYQNEGDLICFAVTNQTILKNPENAKSVLAVGNVQNSPTQYTICTGGRGPTSDGRRKPEIWAPGCSTVSSSTSGCGTATMTGTSMASPAIAGAAMLVRQYYMEGFYPSGMASSAESMTPSGALLRATLMNTGQDITHASGSFQVPTGYPSVQEGWGRAKLDDALYFPGDARQLKVYDVPNAQGLSTNSQTDYTVSVAGPGEQLRITVSWTEPPASAGASSAAINDLDLIVIGPGGTYLGNAFNTATGQSITGGTKDAINSTEQVHISLPPPGEYTVRIRGANIPVGTQGYAVVITGDLQTAPPPPPACYANCDESVIAPVLNVQDFSCFLARYAAGDSYANCDESATPPVLNVADFSCFLGRYAAGCP